MKTVKSGIIGTGFIGPAHIEALRRLGNVDIVALADIDDATAKNKAQMLNIPTAYGDYKELLRNPAIQAVHICTPNHLHYPMAKEALLSGKHVICEKPLAVHSWQADDLIEVAKKKRLVNAIHFNLRFYPVVHQVKAMIDKGELGEIFAVNGSYQQDWLLYQTDYNWRLEPEQSGESRAVADIGSHWMDMIEFVTGIRINRVCADFATFYPVRKKPLRAVETFSGKMMKPQDYMDISINTEDYATVLLRFDNNAHGSLTVNQVAAGRKNRMYFEICGSKKSVAVNTERCNELWIGQRDGNNGVLLKDPCLMYDSAKEITSYPAGHNEGFPDTSKQLFKKVYDFILSDGLNKGRKPDFPTFESGRRELILCENIVVSARKEKWVEIY